MFECKLLLTDVDGTLVDSARHMPRENALAIRRAVEEKGVKFGISSGRINDGFRYFFDEIGVPEDILIAFSGCRITVGGEVIFNATIDPETCRRLHREALAEKVEHYIYAGESWYINKYSPWLDYETRVVGVDGKIMNLEKLLDLIEEGKADPVNKMLFMSHDWDKIKWFEDKYRAEIPDEVGVFRSEPQFLEVMPVGINKGTALRTICEKLSIPIENSMAIGDYFNDQSMIEAAGLGVVMGNAPEELKLVGDYVTGTNDEAGVAEAINRFILNPQ